MTNTMIGNFVPLPDGSFAEFVESVEPTFEELAQNVGMCINVQGACVGKFSGNLEQDKALRDLAESTHPKDGNYYVWNTDLQTWERGTAPLVNPE